MPSPAVTLTGTFENVDGATIASGTVTAVLAGFGSQVPHVAGVAIFGNATKSANISGGSFTLGPIFGNDVISPNTTYYAITMPAPNGGTITKNYQLAGSGSFDLSNLAPLGTSAVVATPEPNSVTPQVFSPATHQFLTGLNTNGEFSSATIAASDVSAGVANSSLSVVSWNGDAGLSRTASDTIAVGNGTQGDSSGTLKLAVLNWNGDTGISRTAVGTLAIGNATQGDSSGILQADLYQAVVNGVTCAQMGADAAGSVEIGPVNKTGTGNNPYIDFHFHANDTATNGQDFNVRIANSGNNQLNVASNGSGSPTGPIINLQGTAGSLQFNGDTGLSRAASSTVAVGNGTANDASGILKATSYTTATANPAASGTVRLAAADTIAFRNAGNSADIALSKSGYDQITATGLSNRILQNFTSTQLTGAGGLSFQAAASKTIKANSLGAHGALLIRLAGSGVTASGGLANITVQFGGTNKTVLSIPGSTAFIFRLEALLANQNQTGQQLITWTSQYNSTLATQSNNTYNIDTTADQTLSLGVIFNNASDNCTFQNMLVEIMPAAAAI